MLMAHPAVLAELLAQYGTLQTEEGGTEARQRLDDLSYTLCISTCTRDIDAALTAARHQLSASGAEEGRLLTS